MRCRASSCGDDGPREAMTVVMGSENGGALWDLRPLSKLGVAAVAVCILLMWMITLLRESWSVLTLIGEVLW